MPDEHRMYPTQEFLDEIDGEVKGMNAQGDPYYGVKEKTYVCALDYTRQPQKFRNALMMPVVILQDGNVFKMSTLFLPWAIAEEMREYLEDAITHAHELGFKMEATYLSESNLGETP